MNKTEATKIFIKALAYAVGTAERDRALLACSKIKIRGLTNYGAPHTKGTGVAAAKRAATKRNNIRKRG